MDGEVIQESESYNFCLNWTIKEFCLCHMKDLKSPDFRLEFDSNEFIVYLILNRQCRLSVNLHNTSCIKKFDIYLRSSILNSEFTIGCKKTVTKEKEEIEVGTFFKVEYSRSDGYYGNYNLCKLGRTLRLICDISLRMTDQNLSLSNDLKFFLDNEKFSDVTLIVEKQEIHAHKIMLTSRSSVFSAMFNSDMVEKQNGRVEITDIDYETMNQVLLYIYTGKVEKPELANKLLGPAEKYALDGLKNICTYILSKTLTIENVIETLKMADLYGVNKLKRRAVDFILENLYVLKIEDLDSLWSICLKHRKI